MILAKDVMSNERLLMMVLMRRVAQVMHHKWLLM
jgi:hypothetical protein